MKSNFNLIELIIVVVVIALLANISILNTVGFVNDAQTSKKLLDVSQIQKVVDIYHLQNNSYPTLGGQPSTLKMKRVDFNTLRNAGLIRNGKVEHPLYVDHFGTVQEKNGGFSSVSDYVVYYGNVDPFIIKLLSQKDLTVLEAEQVTSQQVDQVKSNGGISIGYIPISEVNKNDTYFLSLLEPQDFLYESGVRKESNSGGSYVLDLESSHYQEVLIGLMEDRVMKKGFDGVFLDTVDNISYYFPPERYEQQIAGFENVLSSFKDKHPEGLILQNRGFELGYEFSYEYIDGIMWEGLRSYEGNIDKWYQIAADQLSSLQEQGILVFSIIRGYKTDDELRKIISFAKSKGYINYYNKYDHYNTWPFPIEDEVEFNQGSPSPLDENIPVGSYVSMGNFNGYPLKWQVLRKNEEGLLLFATSPLLEPGGGYLRKEFDVAINNGEPDYEDGSRSLYGSNNWEHSDLRTWLNGPFLSTFNTNELSALSDSKGKLLLNILDTGGRTMGSSLHEYNRNIDNVLENYTTAYSKVVEDKVFLPSVDEVHASYIVSGSEYYSPGRHYWLRDPYATNNQVRYVKRDGTGVSATSPNNTNIGIRPALYLKSGSIGSGDGSVGNPFIIK